MYICISVWNKISHQNIGDFKDTKGSSKNNLTSGV